MLKNKSNKEAPQSIFLKVSFFIIKVNFFPVELKAAKTNLIKQINLLYKGFIYSDNDLSADFTINFVDTNNIYFMESKEHRTIFQIVYKYNSKKIDTHYYIGIFQFQNILRSVIARLSAKKKMFTLHASAVVIRNKTYIFTGDQTAGKSTIMKLLSKIGTPYADDSIFLVRLKNEILCYQTPYCEKEFWIHKKYSYYPLGAIFFINKSTKNEIIKVKNKNEVSKLLLRQLKTEFYSAPPNYKFAMDFISGWNEFYFLFFEKSSTKLINLFKNHGLL